MSKLPSIPIIAAITALIAIPCAAQSASIAVTHNHPTGILQPGETVRLTYTLRWTGATSAARIAGDAAATPDLGIAGAPSGLGSPTFLLGSPVLGSIRGVDTESGPQYLFGSPTPFSYHLGFDFLSYSWTAPLTPGVIDFNWVPHPSYPTPLFYLTPLTEVRSPLPTTYLGTSITVVPAPAPAALLILSAGALSSRRRR